MFAGYACCPRPDLDFFTFVKNQDMKTIRWGIVGCGNVTEVKSGPALQKAAHSDLVAVMRRDAEKAKDYADRHGVEKWYDDAEALIGDPEVDAVYVATPPSTHRKYALMAAAAGKPAYIEKPMAVSFVECQEMNEAFEAARLPLFVAYYRRALPRFLTIKSWIDEARIGTPRFVNVVFHQPPSQADLDGSPNWRTQPGISGGGYFVDLGSHMLDILQFFFGHIILAEGRAASQAGLYPAEDIVSGRFIFASGVQGTGVWCFTSGTRLDRTEIVGDKGKITFATFGNEPVTLETSGAIRQFDLPNPVHIQQPLIQTVVDQLNGEGRCPSTGTTAARTNRVMERLMG